MIRRAKCDPHESFQMHRGLNIIGVFTIAIGFICIFVAEKGEWEGPKVGKDDFGNLDSGDYHILLGLTASIVAFLQPIISLFRCSPTDSKRPIFNWIHRFLGISGWCISGKKQRTEDMGVVNNCNVWLIKLKALDVFHCNDF